MPKIHKSEAIHFLETTLRSVEVLGQQRTINLLKQAITNHNINVTDTIELMFSCVCKMFAIEKNEMLYGTSRKNGARAGSIMCAVHILSTHTKLLWADIAKILNKNNPDIAKYRAKYLQLSNKIKSDKELLDKISDAESLFLKILPKSDNHKQEGEDNQQQNKIKNGKKNKNG